MTTLDTPEQIAAYRMLTIRKGIEMEIKGMRLTRGRTCYAIAKSMGYTGGRQKVVDQLKAEGY